MCATNMHVRSEITKFKANKWSVPFIKDSRDSVFEATAAKWKDITTVTEWGNWEQIPVLWLLRDLSTIICAFQILELNMNYIWLVAKHKISCLALRLKWTNYMILSGLTRHLNKVCLWVAARDLAEPKIAPTIIKIQVNYCWKMVKIHCSLMRGESETALCGTRSHTVSVCKFSFYTQHELVLSA